MRVTGEVKTMKFDTTFTQKCTNLFIVGMELFLAMVIWMLAILFITVGREFMSGEAKLTVSFICCVLSVLNYNVYKYKEYMPFFQTFVQCVCTALVPIFIVLYLFDTE